MKLGTLLVIGTALTTQLMASTSYARDRDCRDLGKNTAGGAVIGGIIGAIIGNNTGNNRTDAHDVATGAVIGGLAGAALDNESCRDDRGVVIVYRDYPGRRHHDGPGRPDRPRHDRPDRYERIVSRYDFDREFMSYFARLSDSWEQSREIRNYSDRLSRRGEKIDGRMLYDVIMRTGDRRSRDQGVDKVRALQDLQYVTARLTSRERYDVESLFDRRSAREASRILSRM
ncbi:MAG: YMGG-like glycine zipper-containing protein [Bdellovibrionota bacterium]